MALSKEESEYINLLDVGQAIVTLKGRVFVPLYVVIPKINITKGLIKDRDIEARNKISN